MLGLLVAFERRETAFVDLSDARQGADVLAVLSCELLEVLDLAMCEFQVHR